MAKRKHRELTQAEVWDDSALIRSWEDAVEEYKHYHSIQAKGEDLEQILREAEIDSAPPLPNNDAIPRQDETASNTGGERIIMDNGDQKMVEVDASAMAAENEVPSTQHSEGTGPHDLTSSSTAQPRSEAFPSGLNNNQVPVAGGLTMPQRVIQNGGQDEGLKNLMMAWYYAGYYTGLYEGRQQGQNHGANSTDQG